MPASDWDAWRLAFEVPADGGVAATGGGVAATDGGGVEAVGGGVAATVGGGVAAAGGCDPATGGVAAVPGTQTHMVASFLVQA